MFGAKVRMHPFPILWLLLLVSSFVAVIGLPQVIRIGAIFTGKLSDSVRPVERAQW
jgi:hypothetical protein